MAPTYNFFQPPANTGVGLKGLTFEGTVTIGTPQTVEAEAAVLVDPVNVGTGVNVVTIAGQNYLLVSVNDAVGSTVALNALNTAASVPLAGLNGASFFLAGGGNLIGTLTPELSFDGGSTWQATFFYNPQPSVLAGIPANGIARSIVVSSPSATELSLLVAPGATNARVRVSAFTSGSSNGTTRATEALSNIQFTMKLDGCKWTYSVGITGLVTVTGATDVFTITGATGVVTRILEASASLTIQTAAQYVDIQIIKRTTANTGGTSSNPAISRHDPQAPAPSSVVAAYTANPGALGTSQGVVDTRRVFAALTGTAALSPGAATFQFGRGPGEQAEVLRAATDVLAINLNAPANAGTGDFSFRFTEE